MRLQAWFRPLRVCLWFAVLVRSSVDGQKSRLEKWIRECNCSCLRNTSKLQNCTLKEVFAIDKQLNIHSNSNFQTPRRVRQRQLLCQRPTGRRKNRFSFFLLNLSCKGQRLYVIYKKRFFRLQHTLNGDNLLSPNRSTTLRPNQKDETKPDKSKTSKGLVIGLSVGFGLMVAIIVCWTWFRFRRRRTKKEPHKKEEKSDAFGYIDEEEDSVPYRIVDLQTNISSDASGYTFLEARKPEEENPYMKLQPTCKTNQNKKSTEDVHDQSLLEEIADDEKDERSYQTLLPQPCNSDDSKGCAKETKDFEEIADDPVYYMLEAKEERSTL